MNYVLHLSIYLGIYCIAALSLNIIVGYCGLLTMAHAAYFAIGSYVYAIATTHFLWTPLQAASMAVGVSVVLSVVVSLAPRRFKRDSFVLISLAVQVIVFSVIANWFEPTTPPGTLRNLTNGPFGIGGVPRPSIFGISLEPLTRFAALSVGAAMVFAVVLHFLLNSPWGRLLKASRDDELVARGLGKDVDLARIQAFAFACGLVAFAGALYASYVGYIDPSTASLDHSVLMLSIVVLGGTGNIRGPLAGAAVLILLPEALRTAHIDDAVAASVRLLIFGILLVVMMHLRPQGLLGEYRVR